MLVTEHEPQRPRPPDLYVRDQASRSSADLSAQPERYHINSPFSLLKKNVGLSVVGDRTDICKLAILNYSSMGQAERPTCPACGAYLTLALPPGGKGKQ